MLSTRRMGRGHKLGYPYPRPSTCQVICWGVPLWTPQKGTCRCTSFMRTPVEKINIPTIVEWPGGVGMHYPHAYILQNMVKDGKICTKFFCQNRTVVAPSPSPSWSPFSKFRTVLILSLLVSECSCVSMQCNSHSKTELLFTSAFLVQENDKEMRWKWVLQSCLLPGLCMGS